MRRLPVMDYGPGAGREQPATAAKPTLIRRCVHSADPSYGISRDVIGIEGDQMARRFPHAEQLVIDGCQRFDWRGGEPERGEVLMSRPEILNHQVERGLLRGDV